MTKSTARSMRGRIGNLATPSTSGQIAGMGDEDHIERAAAAVMAPAVAPARAVAEALDVLVAAAPADLRRAAIEVAAVVVTQAAARELHSVGDVAAWLATLPGGLHLVHLLTAAHAMPYADEAQDGLAAALTLHVARAAFDMGSILAAPAIPFTDARVETLDQFLLQHWKRERTHQPHEWLYHPRRTSLSSTTTRKFLSDLLASSSALRTDAEQGHVACDMNVMMTSGDRHKRLDLVVGTPGEALEEAEDRKNPLRKARVAAPRLTLEVKACMTSHRQATPRLLDELRSSVEVVKGGDRRTIPVALVIVNVAPMFTNPLNLPGPNDHLPRDIDRLFKKLVERVQLDRGAGTEPAYGGLGIVVVDTDNERRIQPAQRDGRVPSTHTYERAVGRAAALYDALWSTAQ